MTDKDFYTNVQSWGNSVLFRGVINGKRIKERVDYQPSLYLETDKQTEFKTLHGGYLEKITFEDLRSAKDFVKKYEDLSNAPKIFGNTRFEYSFIADYYGADIEWDIEQIRIAYLDIEVNSENGFPDPYLAEEEITAITMIVDGTTYAFGLKEYKIQGSEVYYHCPDEHTLCKEFLKLWVKIYPDIITGWYSKFFDIPYIVNRFNKILGEEETRKLSPWKFIMERSVAALNGTRKIAYEIKGISHLDYQELYEKFGSDGKPLDNYKLETVSMYELKEGKLSYGEYGSLFELYTKNPQKFIEYNIRDAALIGRLEDKLKLLEMACALAFDTRSNFEDVFAQTRMWDALSNNWLLQRGIIVPPKNTEEKGSMFEGAYVKDPQVGKHDWVSCFDLTSMYPHLMMQYNISPECLIDPSDYTDAMRKIISDGISVEKLLHKEIDLSEINVTVTPNGQFFRKDIKGFLPSMVEEMFQDRKKFKKLMLTAKQELENEPDKTKHYLIEKQIAKYNNLQLAKKVSLNSCYGALGSQYFRFFDIRMALAVTSSGQLSIRWIEIKINQYMNKILSTEEVDYVIAADTDSIYLKLSPLVHKVYGVDGVVKLSTFSVIDFMDRVCKDKLEPYITKSYEELADYVNAYGQKMFMKREALANKGIWTAKKRYILNVYDNEGVRYKEPQMKVMGLDMIKSSTPGAIRAKMKEVIKILLDGDENDVQKFIKDVKSDFLKMPPEDISFPRGVNGIQKYSDALMIYKSGTPIHVRGAIYYNKFLKENNLLKKYPIIHEGDKIKFVYLKVPNTLMSDVISYPNMIPKEMGIHEYVDYEAQFTKTFESPIQTILDCMGWKTQKQSSLDQFFV